MRREGRFQNSRRQLGVAVILVALIGLALWVRVAFTVLIGGAHYMQWACPAMECGITQIYFRMADSLVHGGGYSILSEPPGYAMLLAAFKGLGITGLQSIRVAQAVIDSCSVVAIFLLLRWAGVGLVLATAGGLVYAVASAPWAAGSTYLLAESLSPALVLWCLVLLAYAAIRQRLWLWAAAGVGIGLAVLVRIDLGLLIVAALVWAMVQRRTGGCLVAVALLLAGFMVPVGAWGAHNKIVHGDWVFLTTGGGNSLWEGLGELPNHYGYVYSDPYAASLLKKLGMVWYSPQANRYFMKEYILAWLNHPDFVLRVIGHRWYEIAFSSELLPGSVSYFSDLQGLMNRFGLYAMLGAVLVMRKNRLATLVLIFPLASALLGIGLVHYEPRYVRYAQLSYLFAGAFLLSAAWNVLRTRATWAAFGAAAAAATIGGFYVATQLDALDTKAAAAEIGIRALASDTDYVQVGHYGLADLKWTPVVPHSLRRDKRGGLVIQTNRSAYDDQMIAWMPMSRGSAIRLSFKVRVLKGAIYIGIIDGTWHYLTARRLDAPGVYDGMLATGTLGQRRVGVMFQNSIPAKGRSMFVISTLDVSVLELPAFKARPTARRPAWVSGHLSNDLRWRPPRRW